MITFAIGIIMLFAGGFIYSRMVEKTFAPDDRPTPAVAMADGVDYVVMPEWKNSLIELLNIAGTGPVLGPIQGILFGPLAFIAIPIGNVIAGSTHDYFNGMISMRNEGKQMPGLVSKYLGPGAHKVYLVVLMVLMILTGVVFVYTPGDLIVGPILGMDASPDQAVIWIVYAVIFSYYLLATLFPINTIIGRIYPIFGCILLISAIGVFIGVMMDGGKNLLNVWEADQWQFKPAGNAPFIPVFFITVACGILSGFHGSQSTLVSRTVASEREGRTTFYMMMVLEGFIAMSWAAGAMVLYNRQPNLINDVNATGMVSVISKEFLGSFGGILAILGVIVLPITSGDTAFRSVRLMVAEQFHIDQKPQKNRLMTSIFIFIPAIAILAFAKLNAGGFNLLWRYFGFSNQFVACFALAMSTVYLIVHRKNYFITLVPLIFYTFIVTSYICHAPIGLGLEARLLNQPESYMISYAIGFVVTALVTFVVRKYGFDHREQIFKLEPIYQGK